MAMKLRIMATPKQTTETPHETGTPRRIYFDDEADRILDAHAATLGRRTRSTIVCALLRALAGQPPRRGEEHVAEQLKRVFGREQFLAFLNGVRACLDASWAPVVPADKAGSDFRPDSWAHEKSKTGVLAFYAANESNMGQLITSALALKNGRTLAQVIVCTTDPEAFPKSTLADLERIGIQIVALGGLRQAVDLIRNTEEGINW